jgi:hypothetical protein
MTVFAILAITLFTISNFTLLLFSDSWNLKSNKIIILINFIGIVFNCMVLLYDHAQ